jgi:hypothetical protein
MIFDPKIDPKTAQDGPKTDPRGTWKPSYFIMIFMFDFVSFWAPFWAPLGVHLGLQIGPKSIQKSIKNHFMPTCPQETIPRGPKTAPRGPQTLPRGSKIAPRGSQDPLKRLSERPRASQDPPKRPQLDPEALWGCIFPPSNLLSKYAQSHSIHHTFTYWKLSRNHQKHPKLFKTNILEPPSFQASLPLSLQVPAAKRLGGIREAQTIK